MIKKILLSVFLLFSLVTIAQQATSSPYSFYGIGDIRFKGTVENRLMGGVSVFADSIHMNLQNPASYAGLKLSTFTIGGSLSSVKLNSYQGDDKAQRVTLDYMAIGMPIFKSSSISFGLIPYSAVGYRIKSISATGVERRYEGEGGLNRVFVGYGYQINKNLSLGADIYYNFGSIETNSLLYVPGIELGTQELNTSEMSGLAFKAGAMYQRKIKKYDFSASMTFMPQAGLKNNNARTLASVQYAEINTPPVVSRLDPAETKNTLKLPTQFSIGAGFGQVKKWLVGTEVVFKQSSSFNNRFADVTQATFENGVQYSFGGYFVPNYNSFSNYFKKITYRAGVRYENTGMVIRDRSIKDYALTAGFSFPLGGAFSNLNLGVEYGRRGTATQNLVEENYTNVLLSISLNDKWFVQRKFD
jgi:hypothetical protein